MYTGFISAIGLLVAITTHAAVLSPQLTITSGGHPRTFYYYKPDNYNPAQGVIIWMHGGSGNGSVGIQGGTDSLWLRLADRIGVLVLSPDGQAYTSDTTSRTWNDCMDDTRAITMWDDVQFVRDLIKWAGTSISPAPALNRVYAAGESKGGQMVERLALEANDVIAAVGNVAGNLPVSNDNHGVYKCRGYTAPYTAGTSEAVPIFLFKGDDDPRIYYGDDGADHNTYCLISDDNPEPPCTKGALHSYWDTIGFWGWKHNLSPSPTQRVAARLITQFSDDVPDCEDTFRGCDGSFVVRRDIGNAPSRIVYYRAFGGGHAFPGPDVETNAQYQKSGWKNRDRYDQTFPYVAEAMWAFFTQFNLAS